MLTGDYDYHGGYYREHVTLATTADFSGLVKNALNKIVAERWAQLGRAGYDWWRKIVTVEHFTSLQSITGTLVGSIGALPAVAEGAEYTELVIGDSPETATFNKYGGYIPLTLELIDRDDARKLAAYPASWRILRSAGCRAWWRPSSPTTARWARPWPTAARCSTARPSRPPAGTPTC